MTMNDCDVICIHKMSWSWQHIETEWERERETLGSEMTNSFRTNNALVEYNSARKMDG